MEIIDLTHTIDENMTTLDVGWHARVSIKRLGEHDKVGRETREITLGSHSGTHIDSPLHFIKGGDDIMDLPLEYLIGEVTIIDFCTLKNNECITKEMLIDKSIGTRVIFKFGWSKNWNTSKFYNNYPFFSLEGAEYLISCGVKVVGMDTPSPDDSRMKFDKEILGSQKDSPIHKIFLRNGVILIEYLANLETLKDYSNWTLVALPLKLANADGAPARVCLFRK